MSSHTIDIAGPDAKSPAPVALKLVVLGGPDEGKEAPLGSTCEVGTDADCDFVLTDSSVSRRHARLTIERGAVVVRDLKSRNGTFVGETRVREANATLGAVLRFGRTYAAVQPRWLMREVAPSAARSFGELFGESLAMREIFAILERVAHSDVTLLVEGESGTGKELVARSVHAASTRAKGPYVVFDCSAVPSELAESELFGHKKGAFSGATSDRAGAFQRAHGGTLCLDELGELPLDLQPKLLRAIESHEVRPVGEDAPRAVDVRVVASTNRELHAEVQRGRFRADLLYRLDVVKVRMPPLRNRPEDIPGLVARILAGKLPDGDEPGGENMQRLLGYAWPGNVRELRNVLARAVALATPPGAGAVPFSKLVFNLGPASSAPATIAAEFPGVAQLVPYKDAKAQLLESFDLAYLTALLKRFPDNVQSAATAAGLSRKHLYDLLRKSGLGDASGSDEPDDGDDPA
ncbi:MAG TPA: sigma 54-interacting transcriptional regulator [Labilithrix sp.]|jgi:DNA-binding NtrC family response regulator